MDNIQRFYSDLEKIKKHYRQEHETSYDPTELCEEIRTFFGKSNKDVQNLAYSFADYWRDEYIAKSSQMQDEPSAENLNKLTAMQALLYVTEDDDQAAETECLSEKDWKELCRLTNYEAEEIPLELLNAMMMIFVNKQAL